MAGRGSWLCLDDKELLDLKGWTLDVVAQPQTLWGICVVLLMLRPLPRNHGAGLGLDGGSGDGTELGEAAVAGL